MNRQILLRLAGLLLTVAADANAGVDQWTSLGPEGGQVLDVAIDRSTTPQTLYAANPAGVFRSVDGGAEWHLLSEEFFEELLVDPSDGSVLYGAAGTLVKKSTNGGSHWANSSHGLPEMTVTSLAIDPGQTSTLYAGTYDGVFKSTDAGASWLEVSSGITDRLIGVLAIDPLFPSTVYAGTDNGALYKTINGGGSWFPSDLGFSGGFVVTALAVSPSASSVVYASGSDTLFKSTNAGASWTDAGLGRVTAIGLSATSPDLLYAWEYIPAGGSGFRRSINGGNTWQNADNGTPPSTSVESFVLADDGAVFAATSRGVYMTAAGEAAWSDVSRGLVATTVRSVAFDAEQAETVYVSTFSSGVFRSTDSGGAWVRLETGAIDFLLSAVATDPSTAGTVYALEFPERVFRSSDHGQTWSPWSSGLEGAVALSLAVAPSGTVYVGTQSQGVYQRGPSDGTWRHTDEGIEGAEILDLLVSVADPNVVYGSGSAGIFRSADAGVTWNVVGEDLVGPLVGPAVDPSDADVLIAGGRVGSGSGIVRSGDGGATWQLVSTRFTSAVAFDPADPNLVYSRNSRSFNGGRTWTTHAEDSRLMTIRTLSVAPDGALYAGTQRRGLFRLEPQPVLTLHDGRFLVEADWRDFEGQVGRSVPVQVPGQGEPVELRSVDSTVLEFFDGDNWEMLIKVLDGRGVNGMFWVFTAAATNVAYTTTVTDTSCGEVRRYENRLGVRAPAVTDTAAFVPCANPAPPSCNGDADTICLGDDGRFQVEVEWTDFEGEAGTGRQVEIDAAGPARSQDSGLLYFFDDANWEVLVKVLDGCDTNDFFWVFSAATTNVEYTLRVTDTLSGETSTYTNPPGTSSPAVSDIQAFAGCED